MRVAVLGAGIAGLSTAHFLKREAARRAMSIQVDVYEAGARPGGRIRTSEEDGYRIEWGANGVQGEGAARRLVEELGLGADRVVARPDAARRYIVHGGRVHLVPLSPPSVMRFGALSARGKLRLLAEPFFARRYARDESVHAFAARHVGEEAASTLIGSVVRGVFAGDARRLSLDAAFPIMREMERKHRSLVVAMARAKRIPGGRTLWAMRGGMEQLVRALAGSLGYALRLQSPALLIERTGAPPRAGWRIALASGERVDADAVVVATPPKAAAALLRPLDFVLARPLAEMPCAGLSVVALGFRPEAFRTNPDGYGFLVSPGEPLEILGALNETTLWPGRAPEGRILIRAMLGGAERPDLMTRSDADLVALSMKALDRAWGLLSGPERTWVIRQPDAIPQYPVGHRDVLRALAARLDLVPGIYLTGNAYRGVSVASLVEDAERVASSVVERMS